MARIFSKIHYWCNPIVLKLTFQQRNAVVKQQVPPDYDARYLAGVEYFNDVEFFEAHDVWEEMWQEYQGESRLFYKGLIQVAVCLHHFGNENTRGARKLYQSSTKYIEPFGPKHEGIDVAKLLEELKACCREIIETDEEFPSARIVPDLIPEIHLDPAPRREE